MGKYQSMVAIIGVGAGSTLRVYAQYASTNSITAGSTGNFCIGNYRISGLATTGSTSDLLSARTALTTTGSSSVALAATTQALTDLTTSVGGTSGYNCYIELKSDDLPAGYPFVAITISTSAQAHPCSVHYVCKPRYPQLTMMPANT